MNFRMITTALLLLPAALFAVDGVILMDQSKAMAGGVTPGDTPGFPITISQPGSYRLDGNLVVPDTNTTAISVQADNVTIDLNGFSIIAPGNASSFGTAYGIFSSSNNLTVGNGMIRGFSGAGVYSNGNPTHVERVHVSDSKDGIAILSGSVKDCILANNSGGVRSSGGAATIENVVAYGNSVGLNGYVLRVTNSILAFSQTFGLAVGVGSYSGNLFASNTTDVSGSFNTGGERLQQWGALPLRRSGSAEFKDIL